VEPFDRASRISTGRAFGSKASPLHACRNDKPLYQFTTPVNSHEKPNTSPEHPSTRTANIVFLCYLSLIGSALAVPVATTRISENKLTPNDRYPEWAQAACYVIRFLSAYFISFSESGMKPKDHGHFSSLAWSPRTNRKRCHWHRNTRNPEPAPFVASSRARVHLSRSKALDGMIHISAMPSPIATQNARL